MNFKLLKLTHYLLYLAFLNLFVVPVQSQSKGKVLLQGKVTNKVSGEPIPLVEVFIAGSTIGCITDKEGNFRLKAPFLPCTLIANHVAFESFILVVENQKQSLDIKLEKSNISISEISVKGKNNRKKNLRFFYNHFIPDKKQLEVINDSVLFFERTKKEFKVRSLTPLEMVNYHLGYHVKVVIRNLRVLKLDKPNGEKLPLNSAIGVKARAYEGYYFMQELEGDEKKMQIFKRNRKKAWYGSLQHFLKALYDDSILNRGYQITTFPQTSGIGFREIGGPPRQDGMREFSIGVDSLEVNFYYDRNNHPMGKTDIETKKVLRVKKCMIHSSGKTFLVHPNGTSPNLTFHIHGNLFQENLMHLLPDDYIPEESY